MLNKKSNNGKYISLGILGEDLAEKYLKSKGYIIIKRNFKNNFGRRLGEIDIIARRDNKLVFFEVKTRSFSRSIPEDNIGFHKIKKLSKIIHFYIASNNLWGYEWQLDALSIIIEEKSGNYKIKHLENIYL